MSILIKGMEMPINCPCELVGVGYDLYCSFAHGIPTRVREYYECCEKLTRPTWCPLVEIPPHGRLIDADALNLDYEVEMADDWKTAHEIANVVKYAPTVFEAEECGHG